MALNTSYFMDTLPLDFDSWDISVKEEYFVDNLVGFASSVDASVQLWILTYLDRASTQGLWVAFRGFSTDPATVALLEYNGTADFYDYVYST